MIDQSTMNFSNQIDQEEDAHDVKFFTEFLTQGHTLFNHTDFDWESEDETNIDKNLI